jgi:ketosteroid isomerase-like protein
MVLAMALALVVSQATEGAVVRELEQIERRLAATWQAGDCSGWGAMIAPGWSVIHITGEVITRAQALEMCKAPRTATETLKVDDLSVRIFGDAAVVTGRTTASTGGAKPSTLTLRFTDVFVRLSGRWEIVASQATQLVRAAGRSSGELPVTDGNGRRPTVHARSTTRRCTRRPPHTGDGPGAN